MINIGNRLECFFDDYLINKSESTAELRLHKPCRIKNILEFNMPWESKRITMVSIFFAECKWRMYYVDEVNKHVCYAESDDAEIWSRPILGMVEFNGSRQNNIIMDKEAFRAFDFVTFDNMSVFFDENPSCPPDEKYKMTAMWLGHASLALLTSADGIHFVKCRLITSEGEFDSQNRMFWSSEHGKYFCYFRGEHSPTHNIDIMDQSYTDTVANKLYDPERFLLREPVDKETMFMRDINVVESLDAKNWSHAKRINTTGRDYQLYNNCIFPYPRAPHIFIGFPLRYTERKAWTKNYDELCGRKNRLDRMTVSARQGLAISDGLFMSSRDGYSFVKYDEAFLPPPPENPEAFVYGDGTMAPALIERASEIRGADNEYMIIARENFRTSHGYSTLVKYSIRLDGFVSLHAGGEKKQIVTKEFIYSGSELFANISTSARGSLYFTIISGGEEYTSVEVFGNSTCKRIRFEDDGAVSKLSGRPVTLKIDVFDADIFSIRFK